MDVEVQTPSAEPRYDVTRKLSLVVDVRQGADNFFTSTVLNPALDWLKVSSTCGTLRVTFSFALFSETFFTLIDRT